MTPTPIIVPSYLDEPVPSPRSSNRKFSLYATRMRDDDSQVPASDYTTPLPSPRPMQDIPSLPPSPRVQIVPFGFAYRHAREPSDDSLSQLPPLPLSPRWDSLSQGSRFFMQPTTSASPGPASPLDPPPHPPSPFAYDAHSVASAPESRNASPTFPTLISKSSLADLRAFDTPVASSVSSPVENFSRPRKQSIRQPITDPAKPRPTPSYNPADQYLELVSSPSQSPLWPPTRPRGPSVSSFQSSSTYHSVLSPPASEFHEPHPRSRPNTNGTTVTSPTAQRPPLSYNTTGGSPSPSAVVAPWMSGEELRSSFRSQFTESTAPGTTVTERSSVLTKDSSVTSLYPQADGDIETEGQDETDVAGDNDDELSLDDLMGMYEKGFDDDSSDIDYHVDDRPDTPASETPYNVGARPASAISDVSYNIGARPATSNSDRNYDMDSRPPTSASDREPRVPFPQIHIDDDDEDEFPMRDNDESGKNSTLDREIRMSKMIFSSPAYIASVPHIAENLGRKSMDKRDSAKSLDSEPSIASHPTALSEKAPSMSSPLAETASPSPISPPISPPIEENTTSLPVPVMDNSTSRPISPPTSPPPVPVTAPPVSEEDPSARDRYGFKKENQYVTREKYDAWNVGYTEYLARRRKKWVAYLKDNALMTDEPNRFPPPNAKTKRFIRKGIPPDWRGAAWFYYAGGPAILAQHSGLYNKLTVKRPKDVDVEAIERDLHRTFPDNIKFKPAGGFKPQSSSTRGSQSTMSSDSLRGRSPIPPPGSEDEPVIITSLRRVLHAFAVYNPRIGYCQSLNFLAGLLLLFVDTEEQCFWLLNVITCIYLPGTHETSLEGSKVDLGVLMTELRDTMPGVWDKVGGDLEAGESGSRPATGKSIRIARGRRKDVSRLSTDRLPPITVCMTAWFMSCFIGTLPIETTLRVWDVFFYEGSKTLFRIALAIFKVGESEIKSVSDPMEMFGVVQGIPRKLVDANALMEACFKRRNGFGHLSQDQIDVRRQERRAKTQYSKLQQQVRTKTTWTIAQSDNEGKSKEKGLFGKKRAQTGV